MALDLNLQPEVNDKQDFVSNQILTSKHMNDLVKDLKKAAAADSVEEILVIDNITPTVTVGGITKGTTLSNKNLAELLRQLLCPYVKFTFSKIDTTKSAGTYEYGEEVSVTSVKPTYSNGSQAINSMVIKDESGVELYKGAPPASGGSVAISKKYNGETGGKISCILNDGESSETKEATFTYAYYPYAMASAKDSFGTTTISGATKGASTSISSVFSITPSEDSYIWFFLPNSVSGKKTILYEGLGGSYYNFGDAVEPTDVSFKLQSNKVVTYKAYKSTKKANKGVTTNFKIQ